MSDISADRIDEALSVAHNKTSCICRTPNLCSSWGGFRMGVGIVKNIKKSYKSSFRSDDKAYDDFARHVRRQWFRSIGCDDSLLVLVITETDQVFISLGSGTRQKLTLNEVQSIYKSTRWYFKNKRYKQGLLHVLIAIVENINDAFTAKVETGLISAIFGGTFLFICGLFIFCYRSGRLGGERVMRFPLGAPMGFQRHKRFGMTRMVGHGRQGRRLTIFVDRSPDSSRGTGISYL
ncbi:uncharacterized protein LOC144435886 [Glandiceps talaboti]